MKVVILSSATLGSVFIRENMSGIVEKKASGLAIHTGKLLGREITLVEAEEDCTEGFNENLLLNMDADYVVSLGEAFSCKKSLDTGDMIFSSAATCLETNEPRVLRTFAADRSLVDLVLKASEKFSHDEKICKAVVGRVFLNPGTVRTGRNLTFLPQGDIYCIDCNGYPLTQWVVESGYPFVLVRTVVPTAYQCEQLEVTRFKWDTAKRNFWVVKGILEGLKRQRLQEMVRKVDLI